MPSRSEKVLVGTSATTLVPLGVDVTWQVVVDLTRMLWPQATREVLRLHDKVLMHSVAVEPGGEPDVWLTWTLSAACAGHTRVELLHEEQDCGAPPPELDELLALVLQRSLLVARP